MKKNEQKDTVQQDTGNQIRTGVEVKAIRLENIHGKFQHYIIIKNGNTRVVIRTGEENYNLVKSMTEGETENPNQTKLPLDNGEPKTTTDTNKP